MCCVLSLRSSDACIKWQLYTATLVLVKRNYGHLQPNKTKELQKEYHKDTETDVNVVLSISLFI